jgi:undecaprenyl diphosphate synthase
MKRMSAENLPKHVAIIMDGNGRWAQKRGLPRLLGHKKGAEVLEETVENADAAGIKYLSVYAFSTENWKRSEMEVTGLMTMFELYIKQKVGPLKARHGRMRFAGRRDRLPASLVRTIEEAEENGKDETGIQLILCVDYGGRQEIVDAVKKIISSGATAESVTEETLSGHMYLPDVPEPDLIIRTSGENRLSNFWLWTGTYSEFFFTDTLWPDFGKEDFESALASYAGRERRKGGRLEDKK